MLSRLGSNLKLCLKPMMVQNYPRQIIHQNLIPKRFSGHNAMNIEPSNYDWKFLKNWFHFYFVLGAVPITVVTTIINIRANPELTEVPEGYEPRHWEYYKHPITRFMAKYFYEPPELEHELFMALIENHSDTTIMKKIENTVDKVMSFYNDHRSRYFMPFYGEYYRRGRDETNYTRLRVLSMEGHRLDDAYESGIVPVEGYKPEE